MEKHLTLSETSDEGQEHSFSEAHLSALREGASRRKKEQVVGNWIRITNPGLFAQLLVEASAAPISAVLEALDTNALFTPQNKAPAEAPRINPYADKAAGGKDDASNVSRPSPPGGSVRTEGEMPTYRKPPPQLNIT